MKLLKKLYLKYLFLLLTGGVLYVLLELLFRGRSHWTMFLLGGICFVGLSLLNEQMDWNTPLWKQVFLGTGLITALEFFTGCIVNRLLGWNVWDYSGMPGNILGQISAPYLLLWIPVSLGGIVLDDWIRYHFFNEGYPHYKFF